jgi:hypothetical protein
MPGSPLHRDPDDADDNDFGLYTDEDNTAVANAVRDIQDAISNGDITTEDGVIDAMQSMLMGYDGGCDTIVKENVLLALRPYIEQRGISIAPNAIYGW